MANKNEVLSIGNLVNELRIARANLSCLVDKAWELGGYCMGDEDFNSLNDIKDANEQIEKINDIERLYHSK